MSLAVILINWRHEQQTLRCARTVTGWQALKPRLIVVDNESTEATSRALSAALLADSLICSAVNLGYGGGNNLGIKRALAAEIKYVLLLNTDAHISPEGVSQLLERLETHPQISIVGPVIHEGDDGPTQRLVGGRDIVRYSSTRMAVPAGDVKNLPGYPIHEVDYVSGTVFLARASLFMEIGLLDEEYFFSGEIADFCRRAKVRGHKICVDLKVEARHDPDQTSVHTRETLYRYYSLRNRFLYVKKHYARQKIKYFSFWTMAGALMLARALLRGKMAKARAIVLAIMHAYGGRYGNQNVTFN